MTRRKPDGFTKVKRRGYVCTHRNKCGRPAERICLSCYRARCAQHPRVPHDLRCWTRPQGTTLPQQRKGKG